MATFKVNYVVFLVVFSLTPFAGLAEWMDMTTPVPVERLLKNAENYIKEHPQDWRGYYVRGRLHSMAFARKTDTLRVVEGKDLPGFAPWDSIMVKRAWKESELTNEIKNHLIESIRNYQKATELAPKEAKPFLGLGWMLEEGSQWAAEWETLPWEEKSPKDISDEYRSRFEQLIEKLGADELEEREKATRELQSQSSRAFTVLFANRNHKDLETRARILFLLKFLWNDKALVAYRQAYLLTLEADIKKYGFGPGADATISLEAGQGILRILGEREASKEEKEEITRVQKSVKKLQAKPRAVTPIIFPLDMYRHLDELLSKDTQVSFDLDGNGESSIWPWVKAETGILVWDPERTCRIESGIQLFGSVTWWIFWENGYQPLNLLDDDRDGWLSGQELDGLAVWRDKNSNGISEDGEVIPAQDAGIDRIAVNPTGKSEGVPYNPQGIQLKNGSILPTYDWSPREVSKLPKSKN